MRKTRTIDLSEADRQALTVIVTDRNSPQKHVWRAQIVLLTAAECGTMELSRRTGISKTSVWRWEVRFLAEGVAGLLHDKSRRSINLASSIAGALLIALLVVVIMGVYIGRMSRNDQPEIDQQRISFLQDQITAYQDRLHGATPDEAAKQFSTRESARRVQIVR
jgi:hypothetical protein